MKAHHTKAWQTGILSALLVIFCASSLVFGQASTSAQLRGTVVDSSSAVMPGAQVKVTNDATQVSETVTTDSAGRYVFNELRPATYTVTVENQGFKTAVRKNVVLRVAQQTDVDFTMEIGEVTNTVEVTGAAALLNTVSGSLGQEVDNKYITQVPLNNRSIYNLYLLAPGVTESNGGQGSFNLIFTSNGQRTATAEFRLDGGITSVPEYSEGGNSIMSILPPIEAVQEFKIQNNSFSAEYGNNGGTVINVASKSGTNQLHGSGYWFSQRPEMNANNFFANRAGAGKSDFYRDQYGGSVGGPIIKQKTFFFFDYDRVRQATPMTLTTTVPTDLERRGDFSQTFNDDGTLAQIFNPNDTYQDANGVWKRRPFAGNVIPSGLFDSVGANVIKHFPAPTDAGAPITHFDNYTAVGVRTNPVVTFDVKIDHNLTSNQRLSGRYSYFTDNRVPDNLYKNDATNAFNTSLRNQNGYIEHSWTMNSTTVWTSRLAVTRLYRGSAAPVAFDFTTLGFPAYLEIGGRKEFPPFDFDSGYSSLGTGAWSDELLGATQYQLSSVMSKVVGAHNLRFGGEQKTYFSNYWQPGAPNGYYTFGRGSTSEQVFDPAGGQGSDIASLLLGWGNNSWVGLDILPGGTDKSKETGFFIQDDWRVTSKLTLNLGLRYEWSTPYTDRYNRIQFADPYFDSGVDVPGVGRIHGAALFATPEHRNASPDRNNWAPRLGFAYRLGSKSTLRGGTGIYYALNPYTGSTFLGPSFGSHSTWITSLDGGITRFGTLSNPFPNGVTLPVAQKYGNLANWGFPAGTAYDDQMRNGEIYQWNVGFQHELTSTMLIDVAYSASRSAHLPTYYDGATNFSHISTADRLKYGTAGLEELVPNPFQSLFVGPNAIFTEPTSIYNNDTIPRMNLLRATPQFDGGLAGGPRPIGTARYNALFVRFEKRYSHGLNFVGAYTFSRTMDSGGAGFNTRYGNDATNSGGVSIQDPNCLSCEYGLSGADTPQRFVVGGTYELPLGRGKSVGKNWGRALDTIIGNWQVNSYLTFQSGQPLTFAYANSVLADGAQRPNINGDPRSSYSIKDVVDRIGNYFNLGAFSAPPPQEPGNSPRYIAEARGSGIRSLDLSLFKNIKFSERMKLELRGEFFNFTNTPRFANPRITFEGGGFGTINSQKNSPRQVQMGARFVF